MAVLCAALIAVAALAAACSSSGTAAPATPPVPSPTDQCVTRVEPLLEAVIFGYGRSGAAGDAAMQNAVFQLGAQSPEFQGVLLPSYTATLSTQNREGADAALARGASEVRDRCTSLFTPGAGTAAPQSSPSTETTAVAKASTDLDSACLTGNPMAADTAAGCLAAAWQAGKLDEDRLPATADAVATLKAGPSLAGITGGMCATAWEGPTNVYNPNEPPTVCNFALPDGTPVRLFMGGTASLGQLVYAVEYGDGGQEGPQSG